MKSILRSLLSAALIVAVLINTALPVLAQATEAVDTSQYTLFAENEELKLYVDSDSLAIKIQTKTNGYIWSSGREFSDDEKINATWSNRINSGVTVDYYDKSQKKQDIATVLGNECSVTIEKAGSQALVAKLMFEKLGFGFDIRLELDKHTLKVGLDNSSIIEGSNTIIRSITLFPFLGSSNESEYSKDGYFLIPDGSGALMEFGKRTLPVSNPYKNKVYGGDVSVGEWIYGQQVLVPVYGVVNGIDKNAFYAEAEKGSAYAEIYAYPAGVMLQYNWTGFTFHYRQNYFQQTGRDGSGFSTIEENRADYDIQVKYNFLNGEQANYTGIAVDYRNTLVERGVLTENNATHAPVTLQVIGSESKKSFFGKSTKTFTTVKQLTEILEDMQKDINPAVRYMAYYHGGYSAFPLSKTKTNSKLGSEKDFENLTEYASSNQIPLYYTADYLNVSYNASGVSKSKDLIRSVDQKIYKRPYYLANTVLFENSFINMNKLREVLTKDWAHFSKNNMNIEADDAGSVLYADYGTGINREQAKDMLTDIFSDKKSAFSLPNMYMWKNTDRFFDISMSSTGYMLFTQDVPFLQIILKGHIDYYSSALNNAGDISTDLLKLIEYGAYPSYHVTAESPLDLLESPLGYVFSSEYRLWKNKIVETTKLVSSALDAVKDAKISGHSYDPQSRVAVTSYDNGVDIIVNYNNIPVQVDGKTIAAKSAIASEVSR